MREVENVRIASQSRAAKAMEPLNLFHLRDALMVRRMGRGNKISGLETKRRGHLTIVAKLHNRHMPVSMAHDKDTVAIFRTACIW